MIYDAIPFILTAQSVLNFLYSFNGSNFHEFILEAFHINVGCLCVLAFPVRGQLKVASNHWYLRIAYFIVLQSLIKESSLDACRCFPL